VNHPLPERDRNRRSADPDRTSGRGRAVPGAGRLACGVAAHSAGSRQITTGAPLLAHLRALQHALVGHVKTYRTEERVANNRLASGAGIAAAAPLFAHGRAEGGNWQYWPALVLAQLGFLYQTDHEHQHHGANCGRDQAPDQSTGSDAEGTKEPASYESANNAQDKISYQAVAAAFHQLSGQPAGYQADDEKPKKMHVTLPPCELRRRSGVANSFEQSWRNWMAGAIGSATWLSHCCATVGPRSFGAHVGQLFLAGLLRYAGRSRSLRLIAKSSGGARAQCRKARRLRARTNQFSTFGNRRAARNAVRSGT